jgi:hypothetical protein
MFYQDPFDVIIGGDAQALRPQWPQREWVTDPAFDTQYRRWDKCPVIRRLAALGKDTW